MVFFVFSANNLIFSQSDQYLKSKLSYCVQEGVQLEEKIKKYENLLNLQTKELQGVKRVLQEKEQHIEELKLENHELQQVAVNIVNVALKLEKEGDLKGATEVYKVLIKSYPSSLEAAASRIRIKDYRSLLEGYEKED